MRGGVVRGTAFHPNVLFMDAFYCARKIAHENEEYSCHIMQKYDASEKGRENRKERIGLQAIHSSIREAA